jgi:hypothetical protein
VSTGLAQKGKNGRATATDLQRLTKQLTFRQQFIDLSSKCHNRAFLVRLPFGSHRVQSMARTLL